MGPSTLPLLSVWEKVCGWFITAMLNFEGSVCLLNMSYDKKRVGELYFDLCLSWAAMLLHNYERTSAELEELKTELSLLLDEQETGHWAACR